MKNSSELIFFPLECRYRVKLHILYKTARAFLKHKDPRDFSSNIFNSSILLPLSFLQTFIQPWLGLLSLLSFFYSIYTGNYISVHKIFLIFLVMQFLITFIAIKKGGDKSRLILYAPFLIMGYKHLIDLIKIKCMIQHITNRNVKWNKLERKGPSY